MIQIEALEPLKHERISLGTGDRISVAEDVAQYLCKQGWAKAVDGSVPVGERMVVKAVVEPHNSKLSASADEAG